MSRSAAAHMNDGDTKDLFLQLAALVREAPADTASTRNEEKLRMYGLYKHVVDGPCREEQQNPSMFNVVARAKFQAWKDCQGYSAREAMLEYINRMTVRQDDFGSQCRKLVEKFVATREDNTIGQGKEIYPVEHNGSKSMDNRGYNESEIGHSFNAANSFLGSSSRLKQSDMEGFPSLYQWIASILNRVLGLLGVRPLVPRGRLDISFIDLLYGLVQSCLWWKWTPYYCRQTSRQIRKVWVDADPESGEGVVAGFSVRSLLDLYLATKKFAKESQVILTPPITVPGMVHVLQYHGLEIVPIDLPGESVSEWIDIDRIQKTISPKCVAIMVVHPFGRLAASADQLDHLRRIAEGHSLELWEDCAECFTGLGDDCYKGFPQADVRFFSFGMIKTSTALGGGIAVFRNPSSRKNIERAQQALPKMQTMFQFQRRLLLALLLNFLSASRWRVGTVARVCEILGLDYDQVVTRSLRGFRIQSDMTQHELKVDLMRQIRQRPSNALLSLLLRRLLQSKNKMTTTVWRRIRQSQELQNALANNFPEVLLTRGLRFPNSFWTFPIICEKRDILSRAMQERGFDVANGASQLCCVNKVTEGKTSSCPNTSQVMDSILYVPIASQEFTPIQTQQFTNHLVSSVKAIRDGTFCTEQRETAVCGLASRHFGMSVLISMLPIMLSVVFRFDAPSTICWTCWLAWVIGLCLTSGLLLWLVCLVLLRSRMGSFYLKATTAFAEHCDMIEAATSQQPHPNLYEGSGNCILSQIPALNFGEVKLQDGGRTVILTGATGFIGSMLLYDLLLHRESLSLSRLVLICREKRGESAESRISALLRKPIFSFLSTEEKSRYVEVLNGDVCQSSAGLAPESLSRLLNDSSITHVFHCAAAVGFTQEFPDAAKSNIMSSLYLQDLTARLKPKDAKFVYISTAFVHGGQCGSSESPLSEELFELGSFCPEAIYRSMLGTQFYASKAMAELDFPNSYTLSKSVCEHLLLRRNSVNTLIVRPSIVGPAVEAPFEGWAGWKPTTIVAGACLHLMNQWNIWYLEPNPVPFIPVDVLSRFILTKAFGKENKAVPNIDSLSSSDGSYEEISATGCDTQADFLDENLSVDGKNSRMRDGQAIFNATWDALSASSGFSWLEFSITYVQLGCVLGYFSRSVAYLGLLVSAQLSPKFCTDGGVYQRIHSLLIRGPTDIVIRAMGTSSASAKRIQKIVPFLDLPLLFFPFLRNTFLFRSGLTMPASFDARRYVFSIAVAAHRFISKTSPKISHEDDSFVNSVSAHEIGGKDVKNAGIPWVASQPTGGFLVRVAAYLFSKILQNVCSVVTVDLKSFRRVLGSLRGRDGEEHSYLILAPTHRSFFDFILLSYLVFVVPEIQLDIPYIIAADDFKALPFIGWLARMLRALYIRRGRAKEDPSLTNEIINLKARSSLAGGTPLEVFLEGARSRDRRFMEAKTGFLKCLHQTGGSHVVVPVTINYERIPEQAELVGEASGSKRNVMNIYSLISWLKDVAMGRVKLGNVHISANESLSMSCETSEDFDSFKRAIQCRQREKILASDYHIGAAAALLDLPRSIVADAVTKLGCKFWPKCRHRQSFLDLPGNKSELVSIVLQCSHLLAPLFVTTHPFWSQWLDCNVEVCNKPIPSDLDIRSIHDALAKYFDSAESAVRVAADRLEAEGFQRLKRNHLLEISRRIAVDDFPAIFLQAAVLAYLEKLSDHGNEFFSVLAADGSPASKIMEVNGGQERIGFWGFPDTGFVVKTGQSGNNTVSMTGSRYALSGHAFSKLLPFIESEMRIEIDPSLEFPLNFANWYRVVDSDLSKEDISFLQATFAVISFSTEERLRHGTGHSQGDVFAIRNGTHFRIPDAVIWPKTEDDVLVLVQTAKERGWCLIPFGGGTNVSNATRCPDKGDEIRPIISVDVKELKQVLWVNEEDGLAHVEAGITGRQLVQELEILGFTMGHEPDSIEFSTLGGWVATKASGMKQNRYGNIEDIVKSVNAVTTAGLLWKGGESQHSPGRIAEGIDVQSLFTGSEGCLGIITSAVIRVWPLPEARKFDSILFPRLEDGLSFVRDLSRRGSSMPASVRLLDNAHFRLGQALRPDKDSSILSQAREILIKCSSVARLGSFDYGSVVCATVTYEGNKTDVSNQEALIKTLTSQNGGVHLGSEIGKAGYDLTFMIAYLRDFAMTYHVLGESFETFAPWSKIDSLVEATKKRIRAEHQARLLPGMPFVGCRVTQLYHEGACLYFYLCISCDGVQNPSSVYSELEAAARDEILKHSGSLSHHHGIGKHRAGMLKGRVSPGFRRTLQMIKGSIDEDNVFGARNGLFAVSAQKDKSVR